MTKIDDQGFTLGKTKYKKPEANIKNLKICFTESWNGKSLRIVYKLPKTINLKTVKPQLDTSQKSWL